MEAQAPALGSQSGLFLACRELIGCDHFAHDHSRAEILGDLPEGMIGHAGHRCEHRAPRQGMPPNRQQCDHDAQSA